MKCDKTLVYKKSITKHYGIAIERDSHKSLESFVEGTTLFVLKISRFHEPQIRNSKLKQVYIQNYVTGFP